ncbi:hypothetical protein BKA64DRAFT_567650 [Cadophora sp. MPI-SDFR-AT-0126]|nr:hypothetical protein BKA64DRAFT_567650 [Leotiomycetes sp. MPI-SDFR-AT-0126]
MDPGSVQVERPEDAIQDADLDNDSDTEDDSPVPDYAEARKFLFEHEAYQNLQARIQAASLLTSREGETIEVIRDTIMKTLVGKHPRLDQTKPNKGLPSLELVLLWNPIDFLIAQYGYVDSTEFKDIITLTGSAIDAQAATCGQYVAQVWPRTGHEILNTLDASIRHMSRFHSQLPDGTKLNVQVCDDFVKVATTGPAPGVADVVEQLIWLGAACQTSPSPRRLAFSNAHVTSMATRVPTFSINYDLEHLEPDSSEENGSCWHALFKNPVIVKGFPIFARRYGEKGLEIPLNMMAGIGEAERATIFGDQLLIKGFSTMFVPTLQTQDSIIWHFVFDGNNKRIPYTAAKERCPDRISSDVISYTSITGRRHFLGWASSVNLNTGKNMKYTDLAFTGSNFARAGCALEKVSISGGKFVTMGASFARGNKDSTLVRSAQGPYEYKIYAASQMKVIFYDTTERCAWLVDGANALLHMTRAQLSRAPCCDSELLDLEKFPYANPESDHRAGYQSLQAIGKSKNLYIFMNDPNFGQSTSAENRWGVKDVVLENWNILEQIQDHQQDLAGPGMQIRLTDRDKLEGFGFLDIISGIPTIRPRVATLESSGRGWVDFTRELNAITLMARGFGELMSPAKDCNNLCQGWARVPKGKDYLVARTDHLKSICEEMGNLESQPLELVQDIYWHSGGALFDACSCGNNSLSCDRVQVLLPKLTIGFKRKPAGLFEGDLRGAVVFGRSDRFSKWWPRNPKVGPKDTEAACIGEDELQIAANATQESIFQDSGLGTDEAQSFGEASASKTKGQQDPPSNKSPPLAPPSSSSNQGKQLQTAPRTVSASRLF